MLFRSAIEGNRMWFTQVSLKNPVFATMMMLAIVVLGLFSYQRMQVDQFPNIDLPVVVVTADYPGASPEIVESEVTKKLEEGVNATITGRNRDALDGHLPAPRVVREKMLEDAAECVPALIGKHALVLWINEQSLHVCAIENGSRTRPEYS